MQIKKKQLTICACDLVNCALELMLLLSYAGAIDLA